MTTPSSHRPSRVVGGVLAAAALACWCLLLVTTPTPAAAAAFDWTIPVPTTYLAYDAATNPYDGQVFDTPLTFATGLVGNATTLNIAVMMHCSNASAADGIPQPTLDGSLLASAASNPLDYFAFLAQLKSMTLTAAQVASNKCQTGLGLYNDFYNAMLLFQRTVNAQCNGDIEGVGRCGIPTSSYDAENNQLRAKINLVFFNLGSITDTAFQTQTFTNAGTLGYLIANNPSVVGRFPIVIPPSYGGELMSTMFSIPCEATESCIVINTYGTTNEIFTCIEQTDVTTGVFGCPADCASKCRGQRRFAYSFNFLFDQQYAFQSLNTQMKVDGASTTALLSTGTPGILPIATLTVTDMSEKGLNCIWQGNLGYNTTAGTQSPALTGTALAALGDELMALDPDVMVFMSDTSKTQDMLTYTNLIVYWKSQGWFPRALVAGAGAHTQQSVMVAAITGDSTDGGFYYGSTPNDFRLRTRVFKTLSNPLPGVNLTLDDPNINFEPYPNGLDGTTVLYGAQVLRDAYIAAFGDTSPVTLNNGYIIPQVASGLLAMAAKLFEQAGTDEPKLLQAASYRVSAASLCGLIQFDTLGRLVPMDQPVVQMSADGTFPNLINPADVATAEDQYPTPTWQQRVFKGSSLSRSSEKVVVAINTICIAFILGLALAVIIYRSHPVMKSASANQCVLALMGAVICLCSNYCTSLYATVGGCAANAWLLTCGFTIMFSALLAKTWRLYRIFESGKLTMVKISGLQLFFMVCAALAVDVLINAIWSGAAPFETEIVVVDPIRPLFNYQQCKYTDTATALVYAQIAWKALLVLAAMVLTIVVRNLPSAFNESQAMGGAIYNCSVLLCFVVPIVATGVGGRETTYLVRNYGVMVLVVSTMAIMFVPKLALINSLTASQAGNIQTANRTVQVTAISHPGSNGTALGKSKMIGGSGEEGASKEKPAASHTQKPVDKDERPAEAIVRLQSSRATAYTPTTPQPHSPSAEDEGESVMNMRREVLRLRAHVASLQSQLDQQSHRPSLPGDTSN